MPPWLDALLLKASLFGGVALIWLGGETGRAAVAGGLGGISRWWMTDRRRLRDGIGSAAVGAIMAPYLGPAVLAIFEAGFGDMGEGPRVEGFSYFAAGLLGMSLAKIIIAYIESKARQMGGGDGNTS